MNDDDKADVNIQIWKLQMGGNAMCVKGKFKSQPIIINYMV